jgi:hypothetical protein
MFTNYETPRHRPCPPPPIVDPNETKLITNIKGKVLGVQVAYNTPLQLYFHLENTCEVDSEELLSGTALFEILTTTHKVRISREYQISEILDQDTNDLCIYLAQDEMKSLKKETYNMRVTLQISSGNFVVFAEKDGYLIVR